LSSVHAIKPTKADQKAREFLEQYATRPNSTELESGLIYTVD